MLYLNEPTRTSLHWCTTGVNGTQGTRMLSHLCTIYNHFRAIGLEPALCTHFKSELWLTAINTNNGKALS
jgi:hypothetical protein